MRSLPIPTEIATQVYENCISRVRITELKNRLAACAPLIEDASIEFNDKIGNHELFEIARETIVNGDVTAKELEQVYTSRMVPKNSPGRDLYNKIKLSAPFGICPLCSHRQVETLDHYLPKAEYPRLAVVPTNLIPSCTDCNKSKLVAYPTCAEEETLHPYFDNIEDYIWLIAEVNHTSPPTFSFSISPPAHWGQLLIDRVNYHFNSLNLSPLYAVQAAVELNNINFGLQEIFESYGSVGVEDHLSRQARSRYHVNKNSWQTALYLAMSNNEWFCNGGFKIELD